MGRNDGHRVRKKDLRKGRYTKLLTSVVRNVALSILDLHRSDKDCVDTASVSISFGYGRHALESLSVVADRRWRLSTPRWQGV